VSSLKSSSLLFSSTLICNVNSSSDTLLFRFCRSKEKKPLATESTTGVRKNQTLIPDLLLKTGLLIHRMKSNLNNNNSSLVYLVGLLSSHSSWTHSASASWSPPRWGMSSEHWQTETGALARRFKSISNWHLK